MNFSLCQTSDCAAASRHDSALSFLTSYLSSNSRPVDATAEDRVSTSKRRVRWHDGTSELQSRSNILSSLQHLISRFSPLILHAMLHAGDECDREQSELLPHGSIARHSVLQMLWNRCMSPHNRLNEDISHGLNGGRAGERVEEWKHVSWNAVLLREAVH